MAAADLYLSFGDALLPLTDVGGQAKPLGSMLAQVRAECHGQRHDLWRRDQRRAERCECALA